MVGEARPPSYTVWSWVRTQPNVIYVLHPECAPLDILAAPRAPARGVQFQRPAPPRPGQPCSARARRASCG